VIECEGGPEVVLRATEVDVGVDQRPVRAGLRLVGETDASGVDHAHRVDRAVELDVGVPADDRGFRDSGKQPAEPLVGSHPGDGHFVAAGRAVAEAHRAEIALEGQVEWQLREERQPLRPEALGDPPPRLHPELTVVRLAEVEDAIGVPSYEVRLAPPKRVQRLDRHRPGRDVAADRDRVHPEPVDLRQHCLQRRQVSVDVLGRRNAHPAHYLTGAPPACSGAKERGRTEAAPDPVTSVEVVEALPAGSW
jgi:hypothetical protein